MAVSHILMPFKEHGHRHQRCLNKALAAAEKNCLARGVRFTKLRRRVLELVWGSHEPVKAYDLLNKLRNEHFSSAPPTIYRALDFLQTAGMVHKIASLNAYVGCAEPHRQHSSQFLICHACGTVAEMENADVRELLADKAGQLGFRIVDEMIEIKGLCGTCQSGKR